MANILYTQCTVKLRPNFQKKTIEIKQPVISVTNQLFLLQPVISVSNFRYL